MNPFLRKNMLELPENVPESYQNNEVNKINKSYKEDIPNNSINFIKEDNSTNPNENNNLKIRHEIYIQIKNKNKNKKRKELVPKFSFETLNYYLEKNQHHSRKESKFEDSFSSSDSYDTSLFNLKEEVPKNFKFTQNNIKDHIDNLNEIIRVFSLCYDY